MSISRRRFIAASAGAAALVRSGAAAQERKLRACVIGDTQQGGYGHGFHRVFERLENVEVVGLADPDEAGRTAHAAEAKAARTYADYREMLEKEKPDLVSVGPRATVNHREYLLACAAIGAHGILEKPLASNLEDADAMLTAINAKNLKWGIGFNFRVLPIIPHVKKLVFDDRLIGDVLEMRGRGKEDHRAGGEDLIVLGTHIFDLMRYFAGDARWCSANITVEGRPARIDDKHDATEPLGPVVGDRMHAMFGFDNGVAGYFATCKSADGGGGRWGVDIYGSKGVVTIRQNGNAHVYWHDNPAWAQRGDELVWQPLPGAPQAEHANREDLRYLPIITSVIECIGAEREPEVSLRDGLASLEMIQAVYAAHFAGARVELPLKDRKHPLG